MRTAQPGEAITLAGSGLTATTRLELWPVPNDTSAPTTIPALPSAPPAGAISLTIFAATVDNVVSEVPAAVSPGAYALYASTDGGSTWGTAVPFNTAQPWYLDHVTAAPGSTVTVIGPGVSQAGVTPQIYVQGTAGLTPCSVSVTSEYEVAFTVPAGLAAGSYPLLVSNGLGGHYGYDTTLTLAVAAAPAPPSTTIDVVADFGADPTGATDATTSIQNALDAAAAQSGGARVSFPAGTYTVSARLSLAAASAGIQLTGAGATKTTVRMSDTAPFAQDELLYLAQSAQPVALSAITFDTNGKRSIALAIDGRSRVSVSAATFRAATYPSDVGLYSGVCAIRVQNAQDIVVDGCDFTCNTGVFLIDVLDTRIQNNTFAIYYPRLPGDPNNPPPNGQADNDGIDVWGARRLTIRGNTFIRGSTTYYYARAVQMGAVKVSHHLFGATDACGVQDVLIARNTARDAGQPGENNGESLIGDGFNPIPGGSSALAVTAATTNTVTAGGVSFDVDTSTDPIGAHVFVVSGTGSGQVRRIMANTTTMLTVDRDWEVVPDSTSTILVDVVHARQLYVHNTITACGKYIGNYGPSFLSVVARNRFDSAGAPGTIFAQCGGGFFALSGGTSPAFTWHPAAYNLVADNVFTGAHAFLSYQGYASGSGDVASFPLLRGNVVARNSASDIDTVVLLADSKVGGSPAGTWGRYNAVVRNQLGSSVTDQAVLDGGWDHTTYQGSTAELVDGGSNTLPVPG